MALKKFVQTIVVQFTKEAIHKYPEAGTDPALADVSFLQYPHRHILHFRVGIEVKHFNRDIEFIQFRRWLEGLYRYDVLDLNYKSMEMISDELAEKINAVYPNRDMSISVFEDGENGSETLYSVS